MAKIVHNKMPPTTPHASENDYRAQGLRILARIIARAYLRDSQFKGKESDNNSESKTK